jgi:hypothetical protein
MTPSLGYRLSPTPQPECPNCNTLIIVTIFRRAECLISLALYLPRAMPDARTLHVTSVCFARSFPSMRLSREQRRALKMLADAPRGVSEEVLVIAHGFSAEMLAGLVLAGLATVVTETKTVHRGLTIDIERIRITTEGRRDRTLSASTARASIGC